MHHINVLMRVIQITALFLITAIASIHVNADQTDPRLDKLFFNLKVNTDLGLSQQLTSEIWRIWSEHNKEDINILFNDGENAMYKKDYEIALASFNKIVELAPNYAEGWNKRATVYFLMGDYHASLADIEKTLRLEPRHFGALSGQRPMLFRVTEISICIKRF